MQITLVAPADGSFVATATPEVVVEYSDDLSGLRLDSLELLLDSVDRTAEAAVTATGLTFTPSVPLTEGLHTLEVAITDHSDNEARETPTRSVVLCSRNCRAVGIATALILAIPSGHLPC